MIYFAVKFAFIPGLPATTKSCFAGKTFRVCISRENKTTRQEGGLFVWTYVYISAYLRLLLHHPNEKLPAFSEEVGFGRRVRGNTKTGYILGDILLEKQNVSMILNKPISKITQMGNTRI